MPADDFHKLVEFRDPLCGGHDCLVTENFHLKTGYSFIGFNGTNLVYSPLSNWCSPLFLRFGVQWYSRTNQDIPARSKQIRTHSSAVLGFTVVSKNDRCGIAVVDGGPACEMGGRLGALGRLITGGHVLGRRNGGVLAK